MHIILTNKNARFLRSSSEISITEKNRENYMINFV